MKKIYIVAAIVVGLIVLSQFITFWNLNCSGDICGVTPDVRAFTFVRNAPICALVGGEFKHDYNGWGGYRDECLVTSRFRCSLAGGYYESTTNYSRCYKSKPIPFPFPNK